MNLRLTINKIHFKLNQLSGVEGRLLCLGRLYILYHMAKHIRIYNGTCALH